MQPRLDVITLAVRDLERSLAFYRDGLGLPTKGIVGTEFHATAADAAGAAAFFQLQGGLMLALYPRRELAKDAGLPDSPPSAVEFSLGYIVENASAVDALLARAVAAGAASTGPARYRPWGIYSGYFRDPDGHLWEVIYNPKPVNTQLKIRVAWAERRFFRKVNDASARVPGRAHIELWITSEVEAALARLPTIGASIVRLYFGLDGGEPMSFEEIGLALGLDVDEVRRIRSESMATLRSRSE